MAQNPCLADLAEQVQRVARRWRWKGCNEAEPSRYPTGLAALDAALGGGFAAGAVHELITAQPGAPARTIALRAAAQAAGQSRWLFYLDTELDFYPPGTDQIGVPLDRLVVVRVTRPTDALWVCEQALRCRPVAAVVLPLRMIEPQASRRLQLAAEAGGGLGLLIRPDERRRHAPGGTFAATRLRLEPVGELCDIGDTGLRKLCPTGFRPVGTALRSVGLCGTSLRPMGARSLIPRSSTLNPQSSILTPRRLRVTMLKVREGQVREPFVVELPDAADSVPAHAVPADGAGAARRRLGG